MLRFISTVITYENEYIESQNIGQNGPSIQKYSKPKAKKILQITTTVERNPEETHLVGFGRRKGR
jgi:hypothetical protein